MMAHLWAKVPKRRVAKKRKEKIAMLSPPSLRRREAIRKTRKIRQTMILLNRLLKRVPRRNRSFFEFILLFCFAFLPAIILINITFSFFIIPNFKKVT